MSDCYYCNFSGNSHCSVPEVAQAIQMNGCKPGDRCSNREVYGARRQPIDDGDVTGCAGLLPEYGWDDATFQHIAAAECPCGPEAVHTDPDTGATVFVHRRAN